jgi:hypothetical protein
MSHSIVTHDTKGSYDNLLIWQSHVIIKFRHKYEAAPNYDDFNDRNLLSLEWVNYKKMS